MSNPDDAKLLTDIIIKRRDKVVAYWIGQTNPLDRFAVARTAGGAELTFDNAAIRLGVADSRPTYTARWLAFDNTTGATRPIGSAIDLSRPQTSIPDAAWGSAEAGCRYAVVSIETIDARHPNWANPVLVTVRERKGTLDVVGIERPTRSDGGK